MRRWCAVLLVTSLAACGVESVETSTTFQVTTTPPTTVVTTGATTTTVPGTTTSTETSDTTTTTPGIPGTPVDLGPRSGDVLMVMGVAHDDVLNLRAGPGTGQPVLETIPPTHIGLVAEGETRRLSGAFWTRVDYEGTVGWAHLGYLGYPGSVEDITAELVDDLGSVPMAASMTGLAEIVAEAMSSDEVTSEIVQVTPVSTGDLHEVSYDVIGFADDALVGVRLHVFGLPDGSGFTLKSVEMMVICGRGVDDGVCV
jgi:uncharacterized protein YraI